MSLRRISLRLPVFRIYARKFLVILLCAIVSPGFSQSGSVDELKKEAEKSFKTEDYVKAYKLYSQLVSNFPKDPEYNFRLGVCMIYAEPDKKKCLPYLKTAAGAGAESPKESEFYLGKAYHINYLFDEAIKHYNTYKLGASSSQIKKLQVDREIKSAANGKHLLSNLTDLEVLSKTQLPENDYFRNYKKVGGKLLVKPDDFKTSTDKKKKEKSVVFLPNNGNAVYFSSYGDNDQNGRDIYVAYKQSDGTFGKPEKVKGINTEFDEDYPFLHPDGKTLYFASKGYNSMGGYDIFKSVYNEATATWESPINMEFPINSPDDDYLFVTDSLETTAYFSTGRQSIPGKIDVLKVKTKRRPLDILAVTGKVIPGSPDYPLACAITIKDLFNGNVVGNFNSEENGDYTLEVPNGGKLLVTVETPGLETQSTQVDLPLSKVSKPFRQTISYEKGKLRVLNYFDEPTSDDDYLKYLKVIEKKAKLDVNEGGNALSETPSEPLATNSATKSTGKPSESVSGNAAPAKQNLSNSELSRIAKQDAAESKQEAQALNKAYRAANEAGSKQKQAAEKKITETQQAIAKAEDIGDQDEKTSTVENLEEQLRTAEKEIASAEKLLNYAKALNQDEQYKQREANLNEQYAKELDKAVKNKNAKESVKKLEDLQKQLADLGPYQSASEEILNTLKQDAEQKEKEIAEKESVNTSIKSNLEEIKTAIADKEAELAGTKKKSAKKRINEEIDELKQDQSEKLTQIQTNESSIKLLNEELVAIKTDLDVTSKLGEATTPLVDNASEAPAEKTNLVSLQNKYRENIQVIDPSNVQSIERSNDQLQAYNTEINKLLADKKQELNTTKNSKTKQQLSSDIKQLEATKNSNDRQLAANNKQLTDLRNKQERENASARLYEPVSASTGAEAIAKLDKLDKQLLTNDNENFEYNAYQNVRAQEIKIEADAKINDAIARQKKLKDEIAQSKNSLRGSSGGNSEELNNQAEDLLTQAQKKRNSAGSLTGEAKTKALTEAKELEQQAQDKLIEADGIAFNETMQSSAINQENIQNLINEGKASPQDLEQAKKLNEEASQALKKASDLRLEANSIENKGARLGSYSNAVEKETEALDKQKTAIELLMKSNPGFSLKQPATSAPSANGDVNDNLTAVNSGLNELANIKLESYTKLYDANEAELSSLKTSIANNQTTLDKTPSLKSGFIAGNTSIEKAVAAKQQSDASAQAGEKLQLLISAVKLQTEGLKQLSSVNTKLSETTKVSEPQVVSTPRETPARSDDPLKALGETAVTETTPDDPLKALANTSIQENEPVRTETPVDTPVKPEEKNEESEISLSSLQGRDTTSGQIINYLEINQSTLRSPQASPMVRKALTQLKTYEGERALTEKKLAEVNEAIASGVELNLSSEELTKKSDDMMLESENLSNQADELKAEAANKSGEDKDYTLAKARELEIKAQDKMIEAASYRTEANENTIVGNATAIDELLEKLKQDDPEAASGVNEKRAEFQTLKAQIKNLHDEANSLSNKAAKLGAISNAEEKEMELIKKQNSMIEELKRSYPDYEVKPYNGLGTSARKAELERKKQTIAQGQYSELTNLINAFSLEYESSKNKVPRRLKRDNQKIRDNAEMLSSESKNLLVKASQETNDAEKLKLLTLAAKAGNAALAQLNKILPAPSGNETDLAGLSDIGNRLNESNNETSDNETGGSTRVAFKTDGLEILKGNAYSAAKPIPIDAKMEDGLVFRVQIGAFKTKIPDNSFKGLSPLNGETTANGYIRYTAGNFEKIENANAVKNDLRGLGYADAFVVVYYNGRRITLSEAMEIMKQEGRSIDANAPQSAGITANTNVPKAAANPVIQESVTVTKELEQINGLLYTIQIGVYTRQVSKPQLLRLTPIFREQLSGGLFRYTAGIYNNPEKLLMDKDKVVALGIKDAFVSAYLNGKRIPFAEAKDKQANDPSIKMETESPIVFGQAPTNSAISETPASAANPLEVLSNTSTGDPSLEPFKNNVTTYPMATPENGVKENESGITFKVQIGAFSKQVPEDVAAKFSAIKNWPIDNKRVNGLYIYNVGNFSEVTFAKELRDEMVALGITDAFLTVYKDGQKLYGAEAENYLRQP